MVKRKTDEGCNNDLLDLIMIEAIRNHVKTYRLTNSDFYKSKIVKWIQQPGRVAQLVCFDINKKEIAYIRIVKGYLLVGVPSQNRVKPIFEQTLMDYHHFIDHRDVLTALSDMLKAIDHHYDTLSRVSLGEATFTFLHYWAETLNKLKDDFMESHSDDDKTPDEIADDMIDNVLMSFRNNQEVVGWMACLCSLFGKTSADIEDEFIKPTLRASITLKEVNL